MINPKLIEIPDEFLEQVKLPLAYPFRDNILLSDTQIKEFCIYPALSAYYTKFPLTTDYTTTFINQKIIPFPDTDTFGILDIRPIDKDRSGNTNGSYMSLWYYQNSPYNQNAWGNTLGTGYNFNGLSQAYMASQQFRDSWIEKYSTFTFETDYQNRQVTAYTNIQCNLFIQWAKTSNRFQDVRFQFQQDVIKLARAHYMMQLADFASIVTNNEQTINIEVDKLKEKADDIFDKIKEKWEQIPDPIIINVS